MHRDEIKAAILAELLRLSEENGTFVRDIGDGWFTVDGDVNLDRITESIVKAIGEDRP